jgi:hypothetical protein
VVGLVKRRAILWRWAKSRSVYFRPTCLLFSPRFNVIPACSYMLNCKHVFDAVSFIRAGRVKGAHIGLPFLISALSALIGDDRPVWTTFVQHVIQ